MSVVANLPSVGSLLREAREARDLSVETVAEELMIRQHYLVSLEDAAYRELPERVYAVGFVQNYAQLLGLDATALVEQFKREAYGGRGAATARMELTMPAPVTQSLLPNRMALAVIGGLLTLLVIGGIIWNTRQPADVNARIQPPQANQTDVSINSVAANAPTDRTVTAPAAPTPDFGAAPVTTAFPSAPALPAAAPPLPAAAATTANTAAAPVVSAPQTTIPQGTRILVEALQRSWVEIADADGNILFTNILALGQALPIPDKAGITLTTGNAAGVQIVLDGKKLGPLGRDNEVKRAVELTPAKLAAMH